MNQSPSLNNENKTVLALTMGEPAGVGGEITLKAWLAKDTPVFFVIDDAKRLQQLAQKLKLDIPIKKINYPSEAVGVFDVALPVLHHPIEIPVVYGEPSLKNASAVVKSINIAVKLVRSGQASAIVTNPINKKILYDAGFKFPGHTEYLSDLAGIKTTPVMMLASPKLRVVPLTTHLSMSSAVKAISKDIIVNTSKVTVLALKKYFSIAKPRLAIAGLNPHAGEGGALGNEEINNIEPAITKLCKLGINVSGPWSPDTMFYERARNSYDVAICMYHDQALIPIKTLDFDEAVNITIGLPFVRTSPDHGTALNIAGTGVASERNLLAALKMASKMSETQHNQ